MAKPRDYKAEYARRIQRGIEKGLSRSQAAGHPKAGELSARIKLTKSFNPFDRMKSIVNDVIGKLDELFGFIPEVEKQKIQNEVEYEFDQYTYGKGSGVEPLPAWSIGDEDSPPNLADINYMFKIAKIHRFQKSYAIVICGTTEEPYPGHDSTEGCLSYRRTRRDIESALTKRHVLTAADFANDLASETQREIWVEVTRFRVIDKD